MESLWYCLSNNYDRDVHKNDTMNYIINNLGENIFYSIIDDINYTLKDINKKKIMLNFIIKHLSNSKIIDKYEIKFNKYSINNIIELIELSYNNMEDDDTSIDEIINNLHNIYAKKYNNISIRNTNSYNGFIIMMLSVLQDDDKIKVIEEFYVELYFDNKLSLLNNFLFIDKYSKTRKYLIQNLYHFNINFTRLLLSKKEIMNTLVYIMEEEFNIWKELNEPIFIIEDINKSQSIIEDVNDVLSDYSKKLFKYYLFKIDLNKKKYTSDKLKMSINFRTQIGA